MFEWCALGRDQKQFQSKVSEQLTQSNQSVN